MWIDTFAREKMVHGIGGGGEDQRDEMGGAVLFCVMTSGSPSTYIAGQ